MTAPGRWSPSTEALLAALDPSVDRSRNLAEFTTYRVGGPAAGFVTIDAVETLEQVRLAREAVARSSGTRVPVLLVGRGSNLLVADAGFDGLVIALGPAFDEIELERDAGDDGLVLVRAGGSALLPVVARRTAAAGLTGFEWAVGVPGSVGGAVRMNAGGHGSDMAASLRRTSVFDLESGGPDEWTLADLDLRYRQSNVQSHQIVLFAELALRPGDSAAAEAELSEIVRWRREHQPGGANAGSVFANPPHDSAGRLIEQAGLKGYRIGSAEVSTKHANFIQADPGGSADDVFALIQHVRRQVVDTLGVALRPENHVVGFARGPEQADNSEGGD